MNWDYIIVGAGSAGCALAHELASSKRNESILVLEAGGSDRSPFIRLPAGAARAITTHDWGYRSQPDPSRNGLSERWIRGRVLGGSSSLNSTVFVRGAKHDFDRWAAHCGNGTSSWSAMHVMPIFQEIETSDQDGALRGHRGPLHVRTVKRPHQTTQAFVESASASGYAFNADYNAEDQEGLAYAQVSQRKGWRCSSADAFLRPLLATEQVKLLLNVLVEKVHMDGRRAVAVSFLHRGVRREERAREIIVCAGSLNSPKLLMLSGIGEPVELREHGIKPLLDLPGVGRNLMDHPYLRLIYRTRVPTYNLTGGLSQKIGFIAKFLSSWEGPLSNVFESVAFLRSSSAEPVPDVQLHFTPLAYWPTPDGRLTLAPYPSIAVLVNKSHPVSRGRIRLSSSDPRDPPRIECRLLDEQSDIDTLVRGIGMVRAIMQESPIAQLLERECEPGPGVLDRGALIHYVRAHTQIANHSAGTCRMGTDTNAVVGPDLRVHGTENLWVADASVMPDLISGNTNATCMMIGKKLGRQFLAH